MIRHTANGSVWQSRLLQVFTIAAISLLVIAVLASVYFAYVQIGIAQAAQEAISPHFVYEFDSFVADDPQLCAGGLLTFDLSGTLDSDDHITVVAGQIEGTTAAGDFARYYLDPLYVPTSGSSPTAKGYQKFKRSVTLPAEILPGSYAYISGNSDLHSDRVDVYYVLFDIIQCD